MGLTLIQCGRGRHSIAVPSLGEGGEGDEGAHRAAVDGGEAKVLPLVEPPPDALPAGGTIQILH